jgi:RHS repeat-associated protein
VAADNSNGEKRLDYQYDLISGKVNQVIYQPGKGDQFIHRYDYDADNRIISVNTSRDGLIWQNDAKYVYHLHGPLARTELGDQKVQGMDYAYTLQGWLKGVNSSSLHEGLFDIGQDGKTGGSLPIVAMDAFGYSLDFYVGDYKPIGQQAFSLNTFTSPSPTPATGFKSLYNGNIGAMVTNIRQLNTPQYTYYHYDQLNRIKRMEALHGQNASANTWNTPISFNGYIESFTYDPNGNIMTLSRNSNVAQIDDLTYNYLAGTNKLTSVTDPIPSGLVNYDIDGQAVNNYSYDRIGNMTADNAEGITNISWTVYGKIKNITKSNGTIEYRYDASGNRIYKKTVISGATTETYYTRDAQGNVMAVYEKQAANPLKWMEQHLYGSSRLGMWNLADVVPGTTVPASGGTVEDGYLYGSKLFELSNHLGNVLVTVSDKKIGIDEGGNGTTDYFQSEVLMAQDYYSFGMSMPGRKYTKPNSGYRYGFNGKEKSNEIYGEENAYDFGARMYDPRLGRWQSTDIVNNPYISPYNFSSNNPINYLDPDGEDKIHFYYVISRTYIDGRLFFAKTTKFSLVEKSNEPNVFVHHKIELRYDGVTSMGKVSKQVDTRFYPDVPGESSGLTSSYGGFVQDSDRKTLIKFIDEYGLSQQDVDAAGGIGGYTEISAAGSGESDRMKNSRWWNSIFASKSAKEKAAAEKKSELNLIIGAALIIAPELLFGELGGGGNVFYRTMSEADAAVFEATGAIPAGTETMISPTLAYAQSLKGVTFQINTKAGTLESLLKMGVRDGSKLTESLGLPTVQKGWKAGNAFFKAESNLSKGLAPQINIGLGNGQALQTFNQSIKSFMRVSKQVPIP